MDSALRPRDIQARIRAGATPEQVAEAAGVPLERIEAFAAPVLAERFHVSGLARTHPVRRRGETTSHRTLRNAVADALSARGLDEEDTTWDSWKHEDRRWTVRITWTEDGSERAALFTYDLTGRFSVAADDAGRDLIGDGATDDLALVRALQEPRDEPEDTDEPEEADADVTADAGDEDQGAAPEVPGEGQPADEAAATVEQDPTEEDDAGDAFHDGELQEVDGVYDIVAPTGGDLDVLYDMLSSFDEDSVKIYAGLMHPKETTPAPDPAPPMLVEVVEEVTVTVTQGGSPEPGADDAADDATVSGTTADDLAGPPPALDPQDAMTEPPAAPVAPAASEPEQLSLIDDVEEPPAPPKPKRQRRKRASVPSWDEIMFGSPHPKE